VRWLSQAQRLVDQCWLAQACPHSREQTLAAPAAQRQVGLVPLQAWQV
jgi:hypothetical protein